MTPAMDSPCVDVCAMDAVTGLCAGCRRTIDEIATWSSLSAPQRAAIMLTLPSRHKAGTEVRPRAGETMRVEADVEAAIEAAVNADEGV